ncbi:MAG: hypothetical protein U5K81_09720 [Trueperaceae bacterium]|nr:hypothetical protein [Trueperaceae bacterium]
MLVYLDQNYASRVAKYLRGQPGHAAFGQAYRALEEAAPLVPPSPFHVLETRGGYLLPTLRTLYERFSGGWWVRPYQDVVRRQVRRGGAVAREDLLTRHGDWSVPATLDPLDDLLSVRFEGDASARTGAVTRVVAARFGLPAGQAERMPFVRLLARLVAFRALDDARAPRPSDLTDLVMAATVAPYVDVLATDRYLRETLQRVGVRTPTFSGRRPDVLRFARWLRAAAIAASE